MGFDDGDDQPFDHRKSSYDINGKIMLTAIISLSFVVILVTILHIYARFILRRQARRQAALRRLGFITTIADIHTIEPPKIGLDSSVIAALPIFTFKQTVNNNTSEMNAVECSVCLNGLEDGEMARSLPNCKHTFHAECIDQWLGSNSTCPICRTEAKPMLVAEPREGVVATAVAPTSAPPVESEGKIGSSSSRLSSFRRMLSRERSSRRIQINQSCGEEDVVPDIERQ